MTGARIFGQLSKAQFWNELVYKDHKANGSDESTQERSTEYIVQKAEAGQSSDENHATGQGGGNSYD